jgi:hypothetical protein
MKKIGDTIEYTAAERDVIRVRDVIETENVDRATAARYALTAAHNPSKAFVEHLSEGALTKVEGKVVIVR